jgi:hypothetical protein
MHSLTLNLKTDVRNVEKKYCSFDLSYVHGSKGLSLLLTKTIMLDKRDRT